MIVFVVQALIIIADTRTRASETEDIFEGFKGTRGGGMLEGPGDYCIAEGD